MTVEVLISKSLEMLAREDWHGALGCCQNILNIDRGNVDALVIKGVAYAQSGKSREAIENLESALRIVPANEEALTWLGNLLRVSNEFMRSIECSRRLLGVNSTSVAAFVNLGHCYSALGKNIDAIECFVSASRLQPDEPAHFYNLGLSLRRAGLLEESLDALTASVEIGSGSFRSLAELGDVQLELGHRKAAILSFTEAARLEPTTARGRRRLAMALVEGNSYREAEVCLLDLISLAPEAIDGRLLLARIYQRLGRFSEARSQLRQVISINPNGARAYFDLAYGQNLRDESEILTGMEHAIAKQANPKDKALLYYSIGKYHDDNGQYSQAMDHFDQANAIMLSLIADRPFDPAEHEKYIGSLISLFTSEYIKTHKSAGVPSEVPVFVVGMIRSGTTLVEKILSSHPEIAGGGELLFWPTKTRGLLSPEQDRLLDSQLMSLGDQFLTFLQEEFPGASRVTDKMPHNYAIAGLLHVIFPNARIIHCRRQPADNGLSIYITPYQGSVRYAHSRDNIASYYRQYQRMMSHWETVIPQERMLTIDYERLVTDTEATTRRLIEFCGLEWSDACLRSHETPGDVRTPSQWQVRQGIYSSSIQRWKHYEPWLGALGTLSESVSK